MCWRGDVGNERDVVLEVIPQGACLPNSRFLSKSRSSVQILTLLIIESEGTQYVQSQNLGFALYNGYAEALHPGDV